MKPVDVMTLVKKLIIKILNLKLVILLEYQNIKIFLKKVTLQIGLKFLWLKKLKILCHGHTLLVILTKKKLLGHFKKTSCKKQIKNNLKLKRQSREKVINYMLNGKDTIICSIAGQIKRA